MSKTINAANASINLKKPFNVAKIELVFCLPVLVFDTISPYLKILNFKYGRRFDARITIMFKTIAIIESMIAVIIL